MLSLPTAILIAGSIIGLGLAVASFLLFCYKIFTIIVSFAAIAAGKDPHAIFQALKPSRKRQEKTVPTVPEMEISSLADSPDAMENMRKMQTTQPMEGIPPLPLDALVFDQRSVSGYAPDPSSY